MHLKKIISYIIVTLSVINSSNASPKLHGYDLTLSIENTLKKSGFTPFFQELTPTGLDNFTGNLIFDIKAADSTDSKDTLAESQLRSKMLICISQDDFQANEKEAMEFFSELKKTQTECAVIGVLTTLDKPFFSAYYDRTGTDAYISSVDDTEDIFAVLVDFDSKNEARPCVTASSKHASSPLWLSKLTHESFLSQDMPFYSENLFSALYRLGFIQGEKKLSAFLSAGIPAISVSLKDSSQLKVITQIAENYEIEESANWDMHYILFSLGSIGKVLYLSETTLIRICVAAEIFVILILCSFSFLGKYGSLYKKQLLKTIYLIPLTLSVTFISFVIGQKCTSLLSTAVNISPVTQFGLKLIFSMFFITILFALQETLHIPVTNFVYGYIISIVALLNIFLFSLCDIIFFLTFLLEYAIIYMSRSAKKVSSLIIYFLLMGLPLAPYAYAIAAKADSSLIKKLVISNPLENLFLSFVIFPFQIMWLKILIRLNVYTKKSDISIRKIVRNGSISLATVTLFIIISLSTLSLFVYTPARRTQKNTEITHFEENRDTLFVNQTQDSFLGMNTNHIHISSKEKAVRYNVSVFGVNNEMPVYDSIYDYDIEPLNLHRRIKAFEDVDAVTFLIPDYPPEKLTIDYASYTNSDIYVLITAIYQENENTYRSEVRFLQNGENR